MFRAALQMAVNKLVQKEAEIFHMHVLSSSQDYRAKSLITVDRSFESVARFKYLEMIVSTQNYFLKSQERIQFEEYFIPFSSESFVYLLRTSRFKYTNIKFVLLFYISGHVA
jgi:hypothetical protein